MPPLPDVPNVVRLDLLWSDSSDNNVSSRMFFNYTGGPPSAAVLNALCTDVNTAVVAHVAQWTPSTQYLGCRLTDLSSSAGSVGEVATSFDGSDAGSDLAGGTALLVNFGINRRYRGGKPRIYLPWGSSANLQSRQAWTASFLSSCLSAIEAIVSATVGSSSGDTTISNHVNVSYYSGSTGEIVGGGTRGKTIPTRRAVPLVDAITRTSIGASPSSQRRRNR